MSHLAPWSSCGTDSQKAIKQQKRPVNPGKIGSEHRTLDEPEIAERQGSQLIRRKRASNLHPPSEGMKMPCRHQRITAVVPLAAEDKEGPRFREELPDASGYPLSRDIHQSLRGLPSGKSGLLGLFHLLAGQEHDPRVNQKGKRKKAVCSLTFLREIGSPLCSATCFLPSVDLLHAGRGLSGSLPRSDCSGRRHRQ